MICDNLFSFILYYCSWLQLDDMRQ